MEQCAGIDVSLESASICMVDASGWILRETKVASEPGVLIAWFAGLGVVTARIDPQAGPLLQWLYAGLRESGLAVELMETRHLRDAFKAMAVKTDRKDAQETLVAIADALLLARATFAEHLGKLQKRLVSLASDDTRARLLMSTSGVGVLVALSYDVPIESGAVQIIQRCWSPFRHDAKEVSIRRHRCHRTDLEDRGARVRTALYEAATVILTRPVKGSSLKSWAMRVAKRAGMRKAKVALARKLARVRAANRCPSPGAGPVARTMDQARPQHPRRHLKGDLPFLDWPTYPHQTPSGGS
jgi:transposase